MKKLSEYENEEAIDILVDLMEPVAKIFADREFYTAYKAKKPKIELMRMILKKHKKDVIEVCAILEGVPVEQYKCNLITLPKIMLEIANDPELKDFFVSQGQMEEVARSSSATETTGAKGK